MQLTYAVINKAKARDSQLVGHGHVLSESRIEDFFKTFI